MATMTLPQMEQEIAQLIRAIRSGTLNDVEQATAMHRLVALRELKLSLDEEQKELADGRRANVSAVQEL